MRVLVVSWGWPSHLLPLVPLAWSFRAAGHDVRVATQPRTVAVAVRAGLPAVAVGTGAEHDGLVERAIRPLRRAAPPPPGVPGTRRLGLSVAIAEDMVDDLDAVCAAWRPDLVLYEPTTYAAPLVAARHRIPAVRVLWGVDFHAPARAFEAAAFAELCERLGVPGFDSAGLVTVDPCPPSLQVPADGPRLNSRWVPYNGPGGVPRWLWQPPRRPRVVVTWGLSAYWASEAEWARARARLRGVVSAVAELDVEVVAAVPSADLLGDWRPPGQVRVVANLPLHLLLPGCAALVSRGGAGSMLAGLVAGIPQVCVPEYAADDVPSRRLAELGAGALVPPEREDPADVREALRRVLEDPAARAAAAALRDESARQPSLGTVAHRLTELATAKEA